MKSSLLPPSSTAVERNLEAARLFKTHAQLVKKLWHADDCPAPFLPFLAYAVQVEEWSHEWSEEKKRQIIKETPEIKRRKGTPSAIRRALAAIGHTDAQIIERANCVRRNGTARYDGQRRRGGLAAWATYRVILYRPVTIDQAQQINRMLNKVKRNCVHLIALDFSKASIRRNGTASYDGQYTRGVVKDQLN